MSAVKKKTCQTEIKMRYIRYLSKLPFNFNDIKFTHKLYPALLSEIEFIVSV
jgi:hypothetical protein